MKIRLITFHNGSNYGAALQAFALQEVLRKKYTDVKIIDYQNRFIQKGLDRFRFGKNIRNCYYVLVDFLFFFNNGRKINRFKEFFGNYYLLTDPHTKEDIISGKIKCDVFVAGSDQIWNPKLNNGLDLAYFGSECGPEIKISYASSFGPYNFSDDSINFELIGKLKKFKSISVREKAELLTNKLGIPAKNTIDPTLLLSYSDWIKKLNLEIKSNKKYLLVYALNDYNHVLKIAQEIASKKNLSIVWIGSRLWFKPGIKMVRDAGPREFVDLFYNASYVVTNSFHGTAFSVNFMKDFVSVIHKSSPERARTLLEKTGLSSRLISAVDELSEINIDKEVMNRSEIMLNNLRNDSLNFLNL